MNFSSRITQRILTTMCALCLTAAGANGQTLFDFEQSDALNDPAVSGDISHFEVTNSQAHGGSGSLRFADKVVEPYENWTYDLPFELTSGTITVWFYDVRGEDAYVGHGSTVPAKWGGAIILEDENNASDFAAVEISEMPYGPKYYATEGSVNRGFDGSDSFDSNSLPLRAKGFHRVDFHITGSETKIFVDGLMADEVAAPGSTGSNLRLRFMYDSPSNAGSAAGNWITAPAAVSRGKVAADGSVVDWIYYDDITITAELPASQTHRLDFEVSNDAADYDTAGVNQGPVLPPILPNDNPHMEGFVNQWAAVTTGTAAHSGVAAARFANTVAPWKSLAFDLSGMEAGTSMTLWFYDSQGQNGSYNNVRANSIIIEESANPTNFHAVEVTTFPFPHGDAVTYYLTVGSEVDGGSQTLYSRALGPRSIGWHQVEIGMYDTYSLVSVDGRLAKYVTSSQTDGPIAQAPGLDKAPKLRILGDSAGIGRNYRTASLLYENSYATREDFAFFDDISLPVATSAVGDWMNY